MMPDLVRAFALFGIAVVNVVGFAQPFATGFHGGGLSTPADRAAYGLMAGLFFMKSYPLFSMMFGAGLSYQLAAAARAGAVPAPRYFRRMAALMVLGVIHFVFFWIGDILFTYGLLGCLLYMLRDWTPRALIRTGIALILVNAVLLFAFAGLMWLAETRMAGALPVDAYAKMEADATAAFGEGSFFDAARYRASLFPAIVPNLVIQQGLSVFGFFCFGLAAAKSGVIDNPEAPVWKTARRIWLPAGLAGSALGAGILLAAHSSVDSTYILGSAVIMVFSPLASLGYAGVIAGTAQTPAGPVRRFLARAGSASLSAYLFQSLALSLIFAAYGAGQFGMLGAAKAMAIAAGIAVASLVFAGLWRSFASRGPAEVLLRRITYWGAK